MIPELKNDNVTIIQIVVSTQTYDGLLILGLGSDSNVYVYDKLRGWGKFNIP